MNDVIYRKDAIGAVLSVGHIAELSDGDAVIRMSAVNYVLGNLPSAQPERKRGKWHITDAYPHNVYCSECFMRFAQTHWAVWEDGSLPRNFCPHCGAKMDGLKIEEGR